ncbi:class I SAM-dependent methyltransferase [Flindersiella endophytica]
MVERARVFGEVAEQYDDVRAGYTDELVQSVFDYLGRVPERSVEVGAGTGKATAAFAARGVPIVCVEPDRQMADVLAARFADVPSVEVAIGGFEDYSPPAGGVDLLYSAQAWHWVDPERRCALGHAALAPGGAIALFGHQYTLADDDLRAALREVYERMEPELVRPATEPPPRTEGRWFSGELNDSGLFTDIRIEEFHTVVPYPTQRWLSLISTFSVYRILDPARVEPLLATLTDTIDAHGGTVPVDLATVLTLARSA